MDLGICALLESKWAHWPGAETGDFDDATFMIDGVATRRIRLPSPSMGWGSTWLFQDADNPSLPLSTPCDEPVHNVAVSERLRSHVSGGCDLTRRRSVEQRSGVSDAPAGSAGKRVGPPVASRRPADPQEALYDGALPTELRCRSTDGT